MQLMVRDVAEIFEVSESQVYRWVHEDDLPSRQVNGQHFFNRVELLEWATVRKIRFAPGLLQEPGQAPGQEETLTAALQTGGVITVATSGTVREAFREIAQRLPLPEGGDRELLLQLLLAREAAGSTAVGDGIAIPHPRLPVVLGQGRPTLLVSYLDPPLDFGAADGQPVHTLLVLVSPTVRAHLAMLARIACILRAPTFRELVRRRATESELLDEVRRIEASLDRLPS